jgi:hypothetical protein
VGEVPQYLSVTVVRRGADAGPFLVADPVVPGQHQGGRDCLKVSDGLVVADCLIVARHVPDAHRQVVPCGRDPPAHGRDLRVRETFN